MRMAAAGTTLRRLCETTVGGTGVRVPAIIISPLARDGYIDHREYETVSILKLLEFRFHLVPLAARDADPAVNDLVDAFTQ